MHHVGCKTQGCRTPALERYSRPGDCIRPTYSGFKSLV